MDANTREGRPKLAIVLLALSFAALYFGHGKQFVGFAWNPEDQACLPNLHLAFFVYKTPNTVRRGDYVFWKPYGALSYVREAHVLKEVAGVPGDRVRISEGIVYINGRQVAAGLENAPMYGRSAESFEVDETISPGRYFVIGTVQYSNDSRYWGYLPHDRIEGFAYRVF